MKADVLIDPNKPSYQLEVPQMDQTHLEFIDLVNQLAMAEKSQFSTLFAQLAEHTEAHFTAENALMEQSGFPAIREHQGEHQRVLADMQRIKKYVQQGRITIGRSYLRDFLPQWFDLHAMTMDSALAFHLKRANLNNLQPS